MLAINRFIERVDGVLKNHCGTQVNKFAVKFGLLTEHANHINRWVSFAIVSKARVVILNLSPNRSPFVCDDYDFPFQLFNGQNGSYLQVLQLDRVTFSPPPDFCSFVNLKMLDLYNVIVLQDLLCFLSKCGVLEWLSIQWCFKLSSLCVPEPLCQLQYLCLQDCAFRNIEFHAPNLTTFEYSGAPALMNLNKCLKLKTATITLDLNNTLKYVLTGLPSILPHVETMRMELFITTKMFDLYPICRPIDLQDIIDLSHYHLNKVCITGFCGNCGQVELAKYILKNALILEHLILKPGVKYKVSTLPTVFEHYGRKEAKEKLTPLARDGVLTIL